MAQANAPAGFLSEDAPGRLLVLYDGDCGICTWLAGWVVRRDRDARLEVVAYQECPAPPMTKELEAACAQALHVIAPAGRAVRGAQAVTEVVRALGYRRTAAVLGTAPVSWVFAGGYRLVAANRGRLSRLFRLEACAAPVHPAG